MHVEVNGTRLCRRRWFGIRAGRHRDANAADDGALHGGPGTYDHSYFKPDFMRLAREAQVVYLDLRDHGRSARQGLANFGWLDIPARYWPALEDSVAPAHRLAP